MATKLGVIIADFSTSLATAMAIGATTASLQSATDDDSIALPAGVYYFAIDGNNSSKEHIQATLSGTSLTAIQSVSRQGVLTSGCVRAHRVGATVTLTDFAHIKFINDLVKGATTLDATAPLGYDGTASITTQNQLATKAYADGLAIAGAPDSSTTVKGIAKMSVAPASPTAPIAVGDNDGRVSTQGENDAQAGGGYLGTPSTSNKFLTETGLTAARVTDVQTFNANGTWTKPTYGTLAFIEAWGGGGSGGSRATTGDASGGGGGGYAWRIVRVADLGATETVTVPAAAAGVSGDNPGNAGGTVTFGSWLTAYGGGAGFTVTAVAGSAGGGGGGPMGAGGAGGSSTGAAGSPGAPLAGAGAVSSGGSGLYGGAGAGTTTSGGGTSGTAGNGYYGGGGGGAATAGSGGSGGTSVIGGAGGAGNNAGSGTAGTAPAGGGGASRTGTSGAGAAGRIKVTVF